MNNSAARLRLILFAAATVLHIAVILLVVVHMGAAVKPPEPRAQMMKLVDVEEDYQSRLPLLPEPPLPEPQKNQENPQTITQPALAETVVETTEKPPPLAAPGEAPSGIFVPGSGGGTGNINYIKQNLLTFLPVLPEREIIRATIYPPIAQRSNIEGIAYLELFVDRLGNVRDVHIIKEDPQGKGFGEAAAKALKGIHGKPAEANGEPVAARYRYNFVFKLK